MAARRDRAGLGGQRRLPRRRRKPGGHDRGAARRARRESSDDRRRCGPRVAARRSRQSADRSLRGGDLLANLAKLGRRPEDIEAVAFTHLHIDHLGWAYHPAPDRDRPAFTGADYLFSEPEWSQRHLSTAHGTTEEMLATLATRARTVTNGEEIFPGVRLLLTPGHTVGHASYTIESGGRRLIAFGDALHSAVQIRHPEWSAGSDLDSAESAVHRRRLVQELQEPNTFGFGVHFADVAFGRVDTTADGPTWHPVA
ncbi:MBL fold metallo-hydrolase [Nonomuraea sp. KM90]|uniref:MBL fold metallo-hydrolase n=1 Tax=Nonomuraea sp. KM90 TaxID=3457428 RepID=UPI003FCC87F4